jgi:hypothetical protein
MSLFIRRLSVHSSVRVEQLGSHWTDFLEEIVLFCEITQRVVEIAGRAHTSSTSRRKPEITDFHEIWIFKNFFQFFSRKLNI